MFTINGSVGSLFSAFKVGFCASHLVEQPMLVCLFLYHSIISSLSAHGEVEIKSSDMMLGRPQSQSRYCKGEQNLLPVLGIA
jgi:hypothetical protein